MAYAALNASTLTLTQEKATLEFTRTIIDTRRQALAFQRSELSTQMQVAYARMFGQNGDEDANAGTSIETFNEEEFMAEFTIAQERLNAQDKIMEMERANIDTKIEAITTALESTEKQLSKNVESAHKGLK